MPASNFILRSARILAVMLIPFLIAGCYKQHLDKETTRGLSNDPYPKAPAKVAPVLRVLIWPDTMVDELVSDFEKRYGVKLEISTFADDESAYEMLKDNPDGWDVLMLSQYMADRMRHEGLLHQVPKLNPYIYKYIDTTVLNKDADPQMKYFIPFDYASLGILFNINYMAGFPKDWDYLADPHNNPYIYGRVIVPDDMRYTLASAMLYLGVDPYKATPQDVENAKKMLLANIRLLGLRTVPFPKVNEEMMNNDALMAVTWSGTAADILRVKQECRFLIPEGKSIMNVDGFCIAKTTKVPDTAALFIEYMLQPYSSLLVANYTMYASVNIRTMKYVDRFMINGPSCMRAAPENMIHMKYLSGAELKLYQDAWAEIKQAQIDRDKIQIIPVN